MNQSRAVQLQPGVSATGDKCGYSGANVLVTGADGFIGSHLTEALVSRDANVTALALYNSFDTFGWLDELSGNVRARIKAVRGDLRDAAFTRSIVKRQDIVFHLAALIAIPHSYIATQSYVETNIIGSLNVFEAAREYNVHRIVHTSTSEVYGSAITMPIPETHPLQGQSPYSASKIGADMMAEAYARSFDLPVAIIRPFNTFGPRQSERAIIPTILRQALDPSVRTIQVGDTSPVRDFTYVDDTVDAFLMAGSWPTIEYGRPYNAGSGTAATIAELIGIALELLNCHKPIQHDPARKRPVHSEVRALLADSTRFTSATGWRPRVAFRDGLLRTVNWWRDRIGGSRVRQDATYAT